MGTRSLRTLMADTLLLPGWRNFNENFHQLVKILHKSQLNNTTIHSPKWLVTLGRTTAKTRRSDLKLISNCLVLMEVVLDEPLARSYRLTVEPIISLCIPAPISLSLSSSTCRWYKGPLHYPKSLPYATTHPNNSPRPTKKWPHHFKDLPCILIPWNNYLRDPLYNSWISSSWYKGYIWSGWEPRHGWWQSLYIPRWLLSTSS